MKNNPAGAGKGLQVDAGTTNLADPDKMNEELRRTAMSTGRLQDIAAVQNIRRGDVGLQSDILSLEQARKNAREFDRVTAGDAEIRTLLSSAR